MSKKNKPEREEKSPANESEDTQKIESQQNNEPVSKPNPIKWVTVIILMICVLIFIWYVQADRHTPYTDQGRIKGLVIPISPRVSGYLTNIRVRLHSHVTVGDTLFQIDRQPFLLAIKAAEARVDNTAQQVSARTASVKSSAGRLGMARAQLDRAQRNFNRVEIVLNENPGALSMADRDQAETGLSQAVEQVASSEADLERAQQMLGVSGPENAQLRAAIADLERSQLDLAFSTIIAPSSGYIESFNLELGFYAQGGQPLATFVSYSDVWIQADMRENNLSNMHIGDKVEIAFDVAPGEVFEGTVRSIGYGVKSGSGDRGSLPDITGNSGWLREPQRFPVIISFQKDQISPSLRIGGQVDVIAYTGDHSFLNMLGRWQIRFHSWISYVR